MWVTAVWLPFDWGYAEAGGVHPRYIGGGLICVICGVVFVCALHVLCGSTTCSTTCSGMLHYMARNDYRRGRRQVSFVVDESLWAAVKGAAALRCWSVTRFVTEILEREVSDGDFSVGPVGGAGVEDGGDCSGQAGGRDRVANAVEPAAGRVDWDALLARKPRPVVESVTVDPIEDIA